MNKLYKGLLVGAAVIGLGGGAYAAQGDKAPEGKGPDRMSEGGHRKAFDPVKFKEYMAKRQKELHDKLKLTAAQEPAWNTFTASMTPPDMGKRPDRAEWAKLSAPERMEKALARSKERQARMETRLASMKTFYAVLTPEQQKTFNENVGMHRGRHGHHGHHGGQGHG
jgi:protein CpxP